MKNEQYYFDQYLLVTKKFRLYKNGRLEVYDHRLATKLNRYTKTYQGGQYRVKKGEEAIFKIAQEEIPNILSKFLVKKSNHSKQTSNHLGEIS